MINTHSTVHVNKNLLTLFLVGAALSIAQFIMIRDFVSILYGEEVVIVLVTASFFFGLSIGYVLSLRLSLGVFRWLFVISVFLHLSFPLSYRYLAVAFSRIDMGGYWYLGLLFCYAVLFSSIFATFLPRLISLDDQSKTTEQTRLQTYYSIELAGFVCGFLIVGLSWNKPIQFLLPIYWVILAMVLYLVLGKKVLTGAFVACAALITWHLHALDYHSTALLYRAKHGKKGAEVLYSVNSPYQKVEVIEDRRKTRYLYLDGLQNLNSTDLDSLNYYIAEVPAVLMRPRNTVLIGNGTLSSVKRVYPHSGQVTSVELDGGVLEAGKRFFTDPDSLAGLERWQLHVDDGKHFLRNSDQKFDLIIMDVPSPLTIQEAYLHSKEFYRLASQKMTDRGVIAVQLSGPLQRNDRTPARVTAALQSVFDQVIVLDSDRAGRSFAYASNSLPFDEDDLRTVSRGYERRVNVVPPERVRQSLVRAVPMSVNSMDLVLRRGWERFTNRYFDD